MNARIISTDNFNDFICVLLLGFSVVIIIEGRGNKMTERMDGEWNTRECAVIHAYIRIYVTYIRQIYVVVTLTNVL